MATITEQKAYTPQPLNPNGFNPKVKLPYEVKTEHIRSAMTDFLNFLGFIDRQLYTKGIARFEKMLMPANFSSMVGEFMSVTIPKYCPSIVKNKYHNGHPDLIPAGVFAGDSILHTNNNTFAKNKLSKKGFSSKVDVFPNTNLLRKAHARDFSTFTSP